MSIINELATQELRHEIVDRQKEIKKWSRVVVELHNNEIDELDEIGSRIGSPTRRETLRRIIAHTYDEAEKEADSSPDEE